VLGDSGGFFRLDAVTHNVDHSIFDRHKATRRYKASPRDVYRAGIETTDAIPRNDIGSRWWEFAAVADF